VALFVKNIGWMVRSIRESWRETEEPVSARRRLSSEKGAGKGGMDEALFVQKMTEAGYKIPECV